MDPNQEHRERCAVCGRPLKERQSKFCSKICSNKRKAEKKRAKARKAGQPDYGAFVNAVKQPVSVKIAESLGMTHEEMCEAAAVDIEKGNLIGFYRDGELRAFGTPLAPGEKPAYKEERDRMTPAERHQARKERETELRERHRVRRKRQKRARQERRRAESEQVQPQAAE